MRIEQYFLITDYSLYDVILNGDSPTPTRVIEGVVQPVAPTTSEQRLARKNELKAREKRFGGNKETKKVQKTLFKQQYENFTGSSSERLDQIHDRLTNEPISAVSSVFAASVKVLVSALPNVDTFDTDDIEEMDLKWQMAMLTVRARKGHFARECRSPKVTRRNGVAGPQRRNVPVETSTSNALVLQCDGVGNYDWGFQAEEESTNYALMAFTSSSSSSSNNKVPSCSKACTKAYATLQSHYDKLIDDFRKSQFDVISYKTRLESIEARLLVYQQNETVFEEGIKLLKLEVQLRDNALVVLRQELKKAKQERDDLKLKLKNLPASPYYDRYHSGDRYHAVPPPYTGTFMPPKPDLVFYNAPMTLALIIEDWVSDSEDDSEAKISQNILSFVQTTEQVKTPRPSLKTVETSIPTDNHKTTIPKPKSNGNHKNRKACFVLLNKSKLVPILVDIPVTVDVPKPHVTRPRHAKPIVTKPHLPPRRHINHNPSLKASNFPLKVTAAEAPMVNVVKGNWEIQVSNGLGPKEILTILFLMHGNPQHALKDKGVRDSRCSRHMTGNMSYMSDFKELNGRYVAFGGNPKVGKISGKGKIRTGKLDFNDVYFVKELKFNLFSVSQMCDRKNNVLLTDTECLVLSPKFKLLDENQVLLRVLRENNMYNVDLKNIAPSGYLTCNLVRGLPTKVFENNHTCVACKKGKQHRASCKTMPVSSVDQPLQRTPSIGFMRPFGCPVTILNTLDPLGKFDGKVDEGFLVGYSNTDDDAAFGGEKHEFKEKNPESEVHVSSNSSAQTKKHDDKTKREAKGKSPVESLTRYRNLSAEFEDFSDNNINEVNVADTPVLDVGHILTNNANTFSAAGPLNAAVKLEDITYSDDEEDVSAEADFTNLDTTITVSLIPTTRVHKDHPMTQIIGDLSLATQTRSMTKVAKDQGGLSQINNDDFYTSYASFMGFMVYQMDVKSAFMYGTIEEEVYVCQPPEFEDPDYPEKVYKVVKALYGLHQAPRAWLNVTAVSLNFLLFDASEGFDQIIDFLNASSIKYALTVNDVTRLQALVDKKKVIITEATIRDALRLNDAESIDCLPNEEIFVETSWNEFSSAMASAVISLFTGRKFNVSKYIFDSLMKNVDSSTKFYMYPRFLQLIIREQVGDLCSHSTKYSSPALIQKVFANMRRVGKVFSGVDTPLFEGMIVAQQVDENAAEVNVDDVHAAGVADEGAASVNVDVVLTVVEEPSIPSPPPTTQPPPPSQNVPSTSQVQPTPPPSLIDQPTSPQQQPQPSQDTEILMDLLHNLLDTCITFTRRVENLEQDKIAQALKITKLKQRVKKLERRNKIKVSKMRRLKKVGTSQRVDTSDDTVMDDEVAADTEIEEKPAELQEVVEVVTTAKLITKVVTAASATVTAAAPTLTTAPSATRRRNGVVIRDPKETATPSIIIHSEAKSKDKGKDILVEEPKPLKKQAQIKQDEAFKVSAAQELQENILSIY
uniref:Uncharacterized protein n=1 Tax=Tanacetum cinerariifolium TaxID=118510 RepID=A0A6L2NP20_TANCI|nr:hypothetical protein [Tanacetum cinerariifolium]